MIHVTVVAAIPATGLANMLLPFPCSINMINIRGSYTDVTKIANFPFPNL